MDCTLGSAAVRSLRSGIMVDLGELSLSSPPGAGYCTAFTRNGVLYRAFFVTGTEDLALTLGLERRKRPSYERPDAHGCRVTLHPRSDYAIHTGSRRPYFLLAYTVQGTLLLPPRLVIAFRPLPSNHTLLTVCALRPFPCKRLHEPAETKKLKTFC